MDWNNDVKSTLTWADGYDVAEAYGEDLCEEDDETIRDLTAAHELWMALHKAWVGCPTEF